jgi:Domain of unknown function (DUF6647)
MLRQLRYGIVLVMLSLAGPVAAQQPRPAPESRLGPQQTVAVANPSAAFFWQDVLLTAIETWLSKNFDLPEIHDHPHIRFVSTAAMIALRYPSLLKHPRSNFDAAGIDVVALYGDTEKTIYLAEGWTGRTPAELSVLVHEMVHHLQHLAGLKYECPQARERLAYAAQDQWLKLFGHDLSRDFQIDPMTRLVRTNCMF